MNIFILDRDIEKCVRYHCDKHVVKMILESVQLLCTALNKKGFKTPYKSTHMKHPCVLWVEESYDNFLWLVEFTRALNREYKYRYRKEEDHKSMAALEQIVDYSFESKGLTEFPQAMQDEYKVEGDAVAAYRNFYLGEKMAFAKWTRRQPPKWFNL
ncbi:hypothetical protein EOPP23_08535 [Endozoicomonas sp. OPT23]|uniref:pyrimidine dimer DNA glycosylase/endonuclease V n=1 Tax=Endozoicomonas sp. OPT23 TaxID=2072845 RepID=UPI00129BBEBE|nr:pyrimidine dimer DNA glycosylase/endonuclease V [Endozoicomonas sp. OPT23]MRI33028.1 hypothetical protein [Endozoicomonas sp. OPT23]